MRRQPVDWFRVILILGGGAGLIYFVIKLGESPISLLLP
jgi:hypothetical protein